MFVRNTVNLKLKLNMLITIDYLCNQSIQIICEYNLVGQMNITPPTLTGSHNNIVLTPQLDGDTKF